MKKLKEILRLKLEAKLSNRAIGRILAISAGAVSNYTRPFIQRGLGWSQCQKMSTPELESILFPTKYLSSRRELVQPDFAQLHLELKKKGVTLQLLWEEYYNQHQEKAYGRTQFCKMYQRWRNKLNVTMRQTHKAGDKLFVDYAGSTVPIIDKTTGEIRQAQIFIAVLGASNYTYAEATWTQSLPDWIGAHTRAFAYFKGVPALLVPDNLKSAIQRACRYEPEANPTYLEMLIHYGTTVLPARPVKPRDKAKVEVGVLIMTRWILARLRHHQFFSLSELNRMIAQLLVELNRKPFKKLSGSRLSQFEAIDKPALRPLPAEAYQYAEFKKARLGSDYHVEVHGHYYSAPYQLVKESLEVRVSEHTVEIFYTHTRVASHVRSFKRGEHTTHPEHMPTRHKKHRQWSVEELLSWAAMVGPKTVVVTRHLLEHKAHPEQGYRACLGLLNLRKHFGETRLEAACQRAIHYKAYSRQSIMNILKNGLDKQALPKKETERAISLYHKNIRGPQYFITLQEE